MTYKSLKVKKINWYVFEWKIVKLIILRTKRKTKTAGKMKIQVIDIDCNFSLKLRNFQCRLGRHQKCEQF